MPLGSNKPRKYEIMFILPVTVEKSIDEIKGGIKSIFSEHNISVFYEHDYGKRQLAYPIKKQEYGYYYLAQVESTPQAIKELEKELLIFPDLLRFMIVRYNPKAPIPASFDEPAVPEVSATTTPKEE